MTEVIYFGGIFFQILAWSWAFWIDGDTGASKEFLILELISFALFGLGILIDFIADRIRAKNRRRREEIRRRRQFREWKDEEWRKAE